MFGRKKVKPNKEEFMARIKALQRDNKRLFAENNFAKETIVNLNSFLSTKREEIGKLEAHVNTLTIDIEKSSARIQELEEAKDAPNKALYENMMQSLSVKDKELSEMQSQYNTEKKRLEDKLCAFRKENEMLNEKLQKEEKENEAMRKEEEEIKRKEEEEIKRKEEEEEKIRRKEEEEEKIRRNKEEEDKLTEEEKGVRRSVLPRNNAPRGEASSAVFTPITYTPITDTNSMWKYRVKAGKCLHCYGLGINKYNVLAVTYDTRSVYLYSETSKREEALCTCPYDVLCLAWNQQGTLLAIGGEHSNNTNNTIQVWDIRSRKIIKRLRIKDINQDCMCLDWNEGTITAGTWDYIYQWNINDQDNDQDTQGNKASLPRKTIQNKENGNIRTVQWSNCKSKLATITYDGNMYIYDEEFKLIHHNKAHGDGSCPLLQWCPWDNQVIATCCTDGYLKIWKVQQDITLIKEVKLESGMTNIKWIPSKKAIITAHWNNQLVLWKYPSLGAIQCMKGHTCMPEYLALNANKSAMVSKSDNEMIFWKPFDESVVQSDSEEKPVVQSDSDEEYYGDGTDDGMCW